MKIFIAISLGFLLLISIGIVRFNIHGNFRMGSNQQEALKGPVIFNETFETGKPFSRAFKLEAGKWDYALNSVNEPVFKGKRSVRFEIRKEQPLVSNGKRCEVVIIKGLPSKEMWYSFAVFFPSQGFEIDNQRELINQWYQKGSPATSLRVRKDNMYLETGNLTDNRKHIVMAPLEKDTWHEIVLHFVHSHNEDGLIEIWYDRKKIITYHGGNMYDDVLPKWKIGIYKTAFVSNASMVKKRILYFDNIRVGNEKASYDLMQPGID